MPKATKKAGSKKGSKKSFKGSSKKKKPTAKAAKRPKSVNIERPYPQARTSEEAAEMLGLSPATMRQLVKREKIAGVREGRNLWISLAEIKKYARERQPVGRPIDTISGESTNKRGWRETEYQREYKRRIRGSAVPQGRSSKSKRATAKSGSKRKATKRGM